MNEALKQRLRELTQLNGVSSREDDVVRYMHAALKEHCDDLTVDNLGNITAAFRSGIPGAQRVMVFGHMDEVGLTVRKVEENGYLRLERVSAVNSHVIPGTTFAVRTHEGKYIHGVVGAKSHHYMKPEEKSRVPELGELAMDIGCRSRAEVEALGVSTGCVVCFVPHFTELANNCIATKAMDDRAACVVLLELARAAKGRKLPFDLFLVASVQEEFSIRGIMPAARAVDADVAIGIDITPAGDSPDLNGANEIVLGGGPAFCYLNYHGRGTLNGIVPNEPLVHFLEDTCRAGGLPFQREVGRGLLTETAYIQISGSKGVATAAVSIPCRYAHTPTEVVCMDDIEYTVRLFEGFLERWDGSVNLKKI